MGCVGSFEEARLVSKPSLAAAPSTRTAEEQKRCDRIDTLQVIFGGTTLVLGAAAGSTGLIAWRVRSDGARDALTITAGVAGILAVGTGYIWDSKQKQWAREGCAQ